MRFIWKLQARRRADTIWMWCARGGGSGDDKRKRGKVNPNELIVSIKLMNLSWNN